jgi:hypothetical protein
MSGELKMASYNKTTMINHVKEKNRLKGGLFFSKKIIFH